MSPSSTISAKIPLELRKKLKKYKINVSELIQNAVEEVVHKKEIEELQAHLSSMQQILTKLPPATIINLIREDRDR